MSKPLIPNPKRESEAATFHRLCFAVHGSRCVKCGACATDSAHIVGRAHLGKLRYSFPTANARPLCRPCHNSLHRGEWCWPRKVVVQAIHALNAVSKTKMEVPPHEG